MKLKIVFSEEGKRFHVLPATSANFNWDSSFVSSFCQLKHDTEERTWERNFVVTWHLNFVVFVEKLNGKKAFVYDFCVENAVFHAFSRHVFLTSWKILSRRPREKKERNWLWILCQFRYRTFGFLLSKIEFLRKKKKLLTYWGNKIQSFHFSSGFWAKTVQLRVINVNLSNFKQNFVIIWLFVLVQSQEIYQMFLLDEKIVIWGKLRVAQVRELSRISLNQNFENFF